MQKDIKHHASHATTDFRSIKINSDRIDFDLSIDQVEKLINKHEKFYEAVNYFDFNVFEFSKTVGRNMQMPFMATALLKQNNLLQTVDFHKFLQFFVQIYNKYKRSVEYHNDLHGADVAQHCHFILKSQKLLHHANFNDLDTLSLIVAALCHDVQHDGFNNRYHVVTKSPICQMYGEDHVQENFHAAQTVKLLDISDYDFLSGKFSRSEIRLIKKRIVESILFTDMASMKQLREEFQNHLNQFGITNTQNRELLIDQTSAQTVEKSKQLISSVTLHACDISTSLRQFELSIQWADLLFDEFFNQGDMEKAQGLDVSMMCDRTTTNIAGGQAGFIHHVVMPIFFQLADICPEINDTQLHSGKLNIEKWKIRADMERQQKEKEEQMKVILSKPGKNKSLSSGGDRKSDKANLSGSEEFDDKNSISQQSQGNLDLKS